MYVLCCVLFFAASVTQFSLKINVVNPNYFFLFFCRTQRSVPTLETGHLLTQKAKRTEMLLTCVLTLQRK